MELLTRSFVREFSEDEKSLVARMFKLLGSRWSLIAGRIPGRNAQEIEHYCTSAYSSPKLSTRSFVREFSEDEESLVARMFKLLGSRWSLIAGRMPGRNAEEIEHYCTSTYSPPTQTNQLSEDEEALVHMMFKLVGGRWHLIAGRIPGRTPEQIRIYWTTKYSAE